MATITHGSKGRTDVSSRSAPNIRSGAKFSKITTVGAGNHLIASGSSGFIITTAGTTVLHPIEGSSIAASSLTAKTLYEIGISRVTGSGTVSIVY